MSSLAEGDTVTVETPRGTAALIAGRYLISAGDATAPTMIAVIDGSAEIVGPSLALTVGPNQAAILTSAQGTTAEVGLVQGALGPLQRIAFLDEMLAELRPASPPAARAAPSAPAPAQIGLMTGGAELAAYGAWQQSPERGVVWYPQVDPGWVPYRDGRWSYVGQWGWT